MRLYITVSLLCFMLAIPFKASCFQGANAILGKWISTEKNVIIDVYKEANQFKANVLWFDDRDDLSRPMHSRRDIHNPERSKRSQLILGMDILENLAYNPEKKRWDNGRIYDPSSGRHWSSVVYFNDNNQMEVKGYWKFEFLCQTLAFVRYKIDSKK